MATEAELARMRRMTDLDSADPVYTDEVLGGMIDEMGVEGASSAVWREKAAVYAGLVDTTESGSSRRLSQLHSQALAMAGGATDTDTGTTGGSFTVEIERV
jgi:hypothetical protein